MEIRNQSRFPVMPEANHYRAGVNHRSFFTSLAKGNENGE